MTNEEIIQIQKDAITTGTGGQLSPEERENFIESGIEQTNLLADEFQVEEVTASTMNIDVIEVASRLLRKGVEGEEFVTKTGLSIPRRQLTPKEAVLYYQITDKFLRRNITREQASTLINQMFSKRFMLDVVDLAINGDIADAGADKDFLNIHDGILVKIVADLNANDDVAFVDNDLMKDVFANLLDAMPNDFAQNEDLLRIYLSPKNYRKYQRELAERNTLLGDQSSTGKIELFYEGVKLVKVSKMPDSRIIHTLTKNFAVGFGLHMTAESQRQAKMRATDYVVTAEVDANYAISKAIVMAKKN